MTDGYHDEESFRLGCSERGEEGGAQTGISTFYIIRDSCITSVSDYSIVDSSRDACEAACTPIPVAVTTSKCKKLGSWQLIDYGC